MNKKKIGVLMGGLSIEKEVSFNSGRTICDHIDTRLYEVIPLFHASDNHLYILPWRFLHRGKISDFEKRLTTETTPIKWDDLKALIDFMYLALHGNHAENGTIQGVMEVLNIPYLGSGILASAQSMNKTLQKKILHYHGIPTPRGFTITPYQLEEHSNNPDFFENQLLFYNLSYPVVVKPEHEGSSLGVSIVNNKEELVKALHYAITIDPQETQPALVEHYLQGLEFTSVTLFDKNGIPFFLPPTEIVYEAGTQFFDYTQKYMPGRSFKITPARVAPEIIHKIQELCVITARALGIKTLARIDGFVTPNNEIIIIDVNTICGMDPASFVFNQVAYVGMSHTDFINHLLTIELGISMHHDKTVVTDSPIHKLRVAVLLGGDNNERETSLNTGRNICYKLSPHAYTVLPIFVDSQRELYPLPQTLLVHNSTKEIEREIDCSTKIAWNDLPQHADFVFIALHGGAGENGAVQAMLEMLNLPYNGSGIATSALCMNKYETSQFLKMHGFSVPTSLLVTTHEWENDKTGIYEKISSTLSFPLVLKPHNDGCSFLVSKISSKSELIDSINTFFTQTSSHALLENYIRGMEITVGVLGNENPTTLPPSYSIATGGILSLEEKFLPGAGENQTPAPLPETSLAFAMETVKRAYETLGCSGYSRIDCFYQTPEQSASGKEDLIILEVNTLPGLTPATCFFHQTAERGMNPMETIDLIVKLGLERHAQKHHKLNISLKDISTHSSI